MFKMNTNGAVVGALGNILTWYSFGLFMPFLHVVYSDFFPNDDPYIGKILAFLAVSVGLFVRPFGAAIFGPIGDKIGRQKAISLSVILMAASTMCIGMLPDYHSIGASSTVLLIFFRALQGISMGGGYTATMVHLVEIAPSNRRGFFGSWTDAGAQIGVFIGGQALIMLYCFFNELEIYRFAWRIPFLLSILLVPFAFMIPNKNAQNNQKKIKILSALIEHKREVLSSIMITAFSAMAFYTLLTFLPLYLVSENILQLKEATICSMIANFVVIFSILCGGFLSDMYRRKPFMIIGMIGVAIISYSMFFWNIKSFEFWFCVHIIYGFFMGIYYSSRSAFLTEAFPKAVRCTAVSFSLSIAQAIFGGLTPMIMNYLVRAQYKFAAFPIICITIAALYAMSFIEDRTGKDLM